MKLKNIFFLLILTILLVPTVLAVPPIKTQISSTILLGVEIENPNNLFATKNQDVKLHFHTFNKTNGVPLYNDTLECHFHLYNSANQHIYEEENITSLNNTFDWEINIDKGNFTENGDYNYIFQCNSLVGLKPIMGGFFLSMVIITDDGSDPSSTGESNRIALFVGMGIIIIFFVLLGFMYFDNIAWRIGAFGYAFIEIMMVAFFLYALESGASIKALLFIQFISIMIAGFGMIMLKIFNVSIRTLDLSGQVEDAEDNKWNKEKKKGEW